MELLQRWPSLADQVTVATGIFGTGPGERAVAEWFARQVDLVDDVDFARTFADHIRLPGIETSDYAHRHVRTAGGELIGGIRFYARNPARPFVDVLGTIDRHNHSSRATAMRAGRPRVLDDVFVTL